VADRSDRRIVILAEGWFRTDNAKTARGVLRYGPDPVVAVIDSTLAGRRVGEFMPPDARYDAVPFVSSLDEALALPEPPTQLLIGIAPAGGKLPEAWRGTIVRALRAGLDVVGGLHIFLGDDPEFADEAAASGASIVDLRRPPERMEIASGRRHLPGRHVILTVGTDCAQGKMSVALELSDSARRAGVRPVFVPTGQTGMMIAGWGVTVDRVAADFLQGTAEWLVEQAEERGDWIFVEGQGSLDHPAYSSVTLGLIHGTTPDGMVMVHIPGRTQHEGWGAWPHPLAPLPEFIRVHEDVAGLVAPSRVVAVALNTSLYADEVEARRIIDEVARETGLPTADPFRFGGDELFAAIRAALEG
jgi:uncharacterized NAD-dependent epimerase/dehydratase family protein